MWIVQEVTVASKVIIVWDHVQISWDIVAEALSAWKSMDSGSGPQQMLGFTNALHLLEFQITIPSTLNLPAFSKQSVAVIRRFLPILEIRSTLCLACATMGRDLYLCQIISRPWKQS
ncbi:uncharacterized protein RCO7_15198 [Rhynchosporium graminicola]|uniref:Uncharacterized protein n=1 Tax=Rhynchosporium graminicola TaxID=2792576 RepID=A0A1E1LQL8_9HELO|nr:uncharacterized protein RCO7_15198 [Rhynchosporium commune]